MNVALKFRTQIAEAHKFYEKKLEYKIAFFFWKKNCEEFKKE